MLGDEEGNEFRFHGVFHGTPTPERIVQTFEYEGAPGRVSLDTTVSEERDGGTVLRGATVLQSVEARDARVKAGMETGVRDAMDRLAELVSTAPPTG